MLFSGVNTIGMLNIKLNDADYKAYLLVAAALMYGNQRLMNKLKKELSSVTGPPTEPFSAC